MSRCVLWFDAAHHEVTRLRHFESRWYILDHEHQPVPVDMMTWAQWFARLESRHVADDRIGDIRISTVFMGLDHSYYDDDPPLIFETMIFGGELDGHMWRYSTWDDAEIGHKMAVKKVRNADSR